LEEAGKPGCNIALTGLLTRKAPPRIVIRLMDKVVWIFRAGVNPEISRDNVPLLIISAKYLRVAEIGVVRSARLYG